MVEVLRSTDQATAIKDKIIVGDNEIIQTEMAMERLNLDLTQIYSPLYFSGPKNLKEDKIVTLTKIMTRKREFFLIDQQKCFLEKVVMDSLFPL